MSVRVSLTERVSIEARGAVVDEQRFPGRQSRLVFAYLLAEQGRPVPRGELAEALWGDEPPTTWEKALSVLVSKLRTLLTECGLDGAGSLTSAFGCYQLTLPAGTWIDVVAADEAASAAERSLAAGELEQARADASVAESLARRTFLPGEDASWVEDRRAHLRETLGRALECLAEAHTLTGDPRAAVRAAEELVELEPYRERGYRLLMEAQSAAGNDAEALRVYERCRRLLDEELGTYPSSETEAIYRRLLELPPASATSTAGTAASTPSSPPHTKPRTRKRFAIAAMACVAIALGIAAFALTADKGRSTPPFEPIVARGCSDVYYDGSESPQLLIAADLPLQPGWIDVTTPMVNAITLAMGRRNHTAGSFRVGLQACGGDPEADPGDEKACSASARTYVESSSVIGVIGPFFSGCAFDQIPILNDASGGPVAIISPSATVAVLTKPVEGFDSAKPDSLYPTGQRNFARTIPTDDVQAAASAVVARELGVRRVYTLDGGDPVSGQFVDDFLRAGRTLGVSAAGRGSWDLERASTAGIADAVAEAGADGVLLGVPSVPASVALLTAIRARLGPGVQLLAPEIFDPKTALLAGAASEGMSFTQLGPAFDDLPANGKEFVAAYREQFGEEPTRYALGAAQAADVMLDAIAVSDGSRASVTQALFKTRVSNGILGSFLITPTGDTTLNAVAVHRIVDGKVTTTATVVVPDALVSG
jgi:DNA-binding SARP family transcriptional activator/ABC-type branched-subunit amino acid transport system substrate-binding protein